MNALLEKYPVTPEDLLALPEESNGYELVDGRLVERNVSVLSNFVAGRLFRRLAAHCEEHGLGWVLPPETGFQCFPDRPNKVRKPDGAFIRGDRMPVTEWDEGYCHVVPDLACEVVSPKDTFDEVDVKVEEYLRVGVRLVWVVSLPTRQVYVHRADGSMAKVRADDELDGEDVVPGFRCRVSGIFPSVAEPQAGGAQS
jgi:Uma2 family endonuclease